MVDSASTLQAAMTKNFTLDDAKALSSDQLKSMSDDSINEIAEQLARIKAERSKDGNANQLGGTCAFAV